MLGLGRARKEQYQEKEDLEPFESRDRELDDGFWEDLFSEALEEELSIGGDEGGEDEDVSVLADRLGYLGSCPPKVE
ncbi:hypothetical protein SLA2020_379290 [Shorea laevis]